jgi:hypothetical protein
MMASVVCVLAWLPAICQTNTEVNRDPDRVNFITSDIVNFWHAYDMAARETSQTKKISIYQTEYLNRGSDGLKDFVRMRIRSAEALVKTIDRMPAYYRSIRSSSLRVADMTEKIRQSFRQFKKIYPEAVFPDVYFLIGIASSGGTTSKNGLLIGTEMYGLTAKSPREELSPWLKMVLSSIDKLPAIVAHESCHFNQKLLVGGTLLGKALQEGSCDFIGEKISGEIINEVQRKYGNKHEAELWKQFESEMNGTNISGWMYNAATVKDKPTDLGYYMGYRITESYYKHSSDKRQAIRDILQVTDYELFLEKSRYGEKFTKATSKSSRTSKAP